MLIEWLDSYGCSVNWQDLAECQAKPLLCRSVGWLAYDGDDCKVIVPHITHSTDNGVTAQGCGDMTIPTRTVLKIADLALPTD